ncbi:hypothetical protein EJ110_NYTH59264 [Nymphaea thermarum]|nr:hypothetical protein EJ110_NYTH59264 [Nymphaea thermarum]
MACLGGPSPPSAPDPKVSTSEDKWSGFSRICSDLSTTTVGTLLIRGPYFAEKLLPVETWNGEDSGRNPHNRKDDSYPHHCTRHKKTYGSVFETTRVHEKCSAGDFDGLELLLGHGHGEDAMFHCRPHLINPGVFRQPESAEELAPAPLDAVPAIVPLLNLLTPLAADLKHAALLDLDLHLLLP